MTFACNRLFGSLGKTRGPVVPARASLRSITSQANGTAADFRFSFMIRSEFEAFKFGEKAMLMGAPFDSDLQLAAVRVRLV